MLRPLDIQYAQAEALLIKYTINQFRKKCIKWYLKIKIKLLAKIVLKFQKIQEKRSLNVFNIITSSLHYIALVNVLIIRANSSPLAIRVPSDQVT